MMIKDNKYVRGYKEKIFDIFNVIFLFTYIFQPDLSKISILHFLTLYMLFVITLDIIKNNGGRIKVERSIIKYIYPFVPFLIYVFLDYTLISILGSTGGSLPLKNLIILYMTLLRIVLSTVYLLNLIKYHGYTLDRIIDTLIVVGIIQTLCVLAAFAFPSVRNFFNGLTLKNADSVYILSALSHDIWRSYGFAGNIFDSFGYVTALIIIITFAKGIRNGKIRIIALSFFMLIMPLLNARTGLFLCMGGFFIVVVTIKKSFDLKKIMKVMLVFVIIALIIPRLYQLLPSMTREWLRVGFEATIKLFTTGEKTSAYTKILEQNFIFPDNLIFGKAADPFDIIHIGIESGYINCLWRFGLIGTVLLLGGYLLFFWKIFFALKNDFSKSIILACLAVFFVYLIKLFSIYNTGASIILIGLPVCMVYFEYKGRVNDNVR